MRNGWESERLVYRALQDTDVDHTFMHNAIASDPIGFPLAYSEAFRPQSTTMTAALFATLRKKSLSVVICLPTDNPIEATTMYESSQQEILPAQAESKTQSEASTLMPIGILTLTAPEPENHHHRKTMLGISVINAYQGRGYGPEAINWGLDWAFEFGGMHRVGATCYGYNDRGKRLYEKLGFIHYGILDSEWEKLRLV
ncbi:acyl-CoA N-acyltransferase [Hypoxylon rubiginosum]|uniref:Acyl-CoA N-acyltransferase n=1 Tax=Hypoxylon rubiginosum TaxID=110542 RepID=A0ACC0CNX5_9PEZI|nr:acyl-CoA N-acyltransferase [Hypoxylon rubiginosum]